MIEAVKIKLQPISSEAFRPYGRMLDGSQPIFPEIDAGEGRLGMELREVKERPATKRVSMMSTHFSYNQTFVILKGSMVLIVAPAPSNREAGPQRYEFDYGRAAAFVLNPGQAALIDKGVCHAAFMVGHECRYINLTRKDPWEGTNPDDEGRIDVIQQRRKYIEVIQLEQRDNRVLELDLDGLPSLIHPA